MAYTVTNLITDSYYASGIVSRQFETVQGYQLQAAFGWLNQLLQDKAVDSGDIPYINTLYPFYGVAGQEQYFIPGLISIDAIVFYIGSVRYQMQYVPRGKYFGTPRANNINALPLSYTYERTFGGVNLFLYFFPNTNYLFNITGNFFMQVVDLNQDLTTKVTRFNLGSAHTAGTGTLAATELVINGTDLAGTYGVSTPLTTLAAAINADVDNITAQVVNNELVLTGEYDFSTVISTAGTQDTADYLSFSNFSTINGAIYKTIFPFALDQFYIDYLRYQLADRDCTELNFATPPQVLEQLNRYREQIINMAEPLDLSIDKTSVLTQSNGINYGQVNIGKGWSTS